MYFTISAPSLTKPTYQTLEEYATRRFQKIEKLLRKSDTTDHEVRISVEKSGDMYSLKSEVFVPTHVVAKAKDRDLRKVVDIAVKHMQRVLKDGHEKAVDKKIKRNRFAKFIPFWRK